MDACGVSLCVPGLLLLPEQQPRATPGSECGDGLEKHLMLPFHPVEMSSKPWPS